jgi:uncharacterized protein YfaP (DUF2135 family)
VSPRARRVIRRVIAMVVVVDFLAALLQCQAAIISLSTIEQRVPTVDTSGAYALVLRWPKTLAKDDLDLYVRDPAGNIAWYAGLDAGQMHLEHDDLADADTGYGRKPNFERVVIRTAIPGEYTVNVDVYQNDGAHSEPASVELWRLNVQNGLLRTKNLTTGQTGDEQTAFRFTLDAAGNVTGYGSLPVSLVSLAKAGQ